MKKRELLERKKKKKKKVMEGITFVLVRPGVLFSVQLEEAAAKQLGFFVQREFALPKIWSLMTK